MSKIIGPSVSLNGLVLWLDAANPKSYTSGSTTWYDMSGNNNHGTLVSGSGYSSANMGSITFDGVNDYVNIGVDKSCNRFTADFTISAWVYRSGSSGTWGNIMGDYYTGGTANALEWQIAIDNTARLFVYNGTGGFLMNNIVSGFSVNSWINVVLSRIGSTLRLYANTNLIASITNTTTFGSATGNFNIGIDGNNKAEPLTGYISNVLIYKNKGLTSDEVLQNYTALKSRYGL